MQLIVRDITDREAGIARLRESEARYKMMVETANEFVVRLEVPGIPRENLDINLTGQMLTITGKRETKTEKAEETYLVRERLYGKFVRTARLPVPVAAAKVTATFEEGMLVVHLPKAEPAPANKILIK